MLQLSISAAQEKIKYFRDYIKEFYGADYCCSKIQNSSFDINVLGVSKFESLKIIINKEQILTKNIYVFSFDINDTYLLTNFQNSYATESSSESVKKAAKKIINEDERNTISFELTTIIDSPKN